MAVTVTRKLEFDAAHRLLNHEGKCRHLHGHRYVAEITCVADELDSVGRVIDFSVIKRLVGGWIDENWDHNIILNTEDPLLNLPMKLNGAIFARKEPAVVTFNPTAENMAKSLYNLSKRLLRQHGVNVVSIKLWETPNCFAIYEPEEE